MGGLNLSLLDQLTFYGSYHTNKWNQIIHFVFVPTIVWTIMVWLSYSGPLLPLGLQEQLQANLPAAISGYAVANGAFLLLAAYTLLYLGLDPLAGITWAALVGVPMWLAATAFHQTTTEAWRWAIPLHVFSWYMQLHPGHALLEKRKPALLDSLVQAFAMAPLFVWFELLFLFGYRPQLKRELQSRVGREVQAHRRSQKARAAFKTN